MADGAAGKDGSKTPVPSEAALSARLKSLGTKLDQVEQRVPEQRNSQTSGSDPSAMARGFRLSAELVAGVLVGAVIGWLLDRFLGITPWGMIVFVLLGFVAGVLNVMRAAGVVSPSKLPGGEIDKP